jgi:HPt (histidine-containing phosphotransfer) domain-containing protein
VDSQARLEERLAALRDSFVAALPSRLAGLRAALASGDRVAVQLEAHRLAGTGLSYGVPELTQWGRTVEQLCKAAAPATDLAHALDELALLLRHLPPAVPSPEGADAMTLSAR